jgi:CTP synthase
MLEEGLDVVALKKLDLPKKAAPDLKIWNTFTQNKKKAYYKHRLDW